MLVARAREMAIGRDALVRAARDRGAALVLSGDAGVGKSHLLAALAAEARERGFHVLLGRCFADAGQRAFAPWREALGEETFAASTGESRASLGALGDRARTFEAVLAAIAARADARAVVVGLEDLHWADRDSLALFLHVARFALRAGALLVGTVRAPDLDGARNEALDEVLAELARDERSVHLSLRPFSEVEVGELCAALGGGDVPQAMARTIHAETGGNALYVREIMRHLVEEGKVALRDGRLATDFSASELGLPPSIRHLVRQRVARLSERAAALVRGASVVSAPVDLATLAEVAGLDVDAALDALDESLASGVMRATGARYELGHAIVRRAIHEDLSPDRRARLHRRAADALARASSPDHAEIAAQLHASRALSGAERGVSHAILAAEAASRTGAHERAAALLTIADDLVAPLGAEAAADVACRLALAHALALDGPATVVAAARAVELLHDAGDDSRVPGLLVDVARELAKGGVARATWEPLVTRARAALGDERGLLWARLSLLESRPVIVAEGEVHVARFSPHDPEAVRLLRDEGTEIDFADTVDIHETRTPAQTAELLARAERFTDPGAIVRVVDACTRDLFFAAEDFGAVIARAEGLLARSERVGSVMGQLGALVLLGCSRGALGDLPAARVALERSSALSRRIGAMHRMSVIGPFAVGDRRRLRRRRGLARHRGAAALVRQVAARRDHAVRPRRAEPLAARLGARRRRRHVRAPPADPRRAPRVLLRGLRGVVRRPRLRRDRVLPPRRAGARRTLPGARRARCSARRRLLELRPRERRAHDRAPRRSRGRARALGASRMLKNRSVSA
jgi:ABC-type cobalamin transport system ATPase subunit